MPIPPTNDALPVHDLDALQASVRTLLALEVKPSEIEAMLNEARATPAARIEALVAMERSTHPLRIVQALSKAAQRDHLWAGLPGACRRWGVHPASLVACETRRPVSLGNALGLPSRFTHSLPGKRPAKTKLGHWFPQPGFLGATLPEGLVLQNLGLCNQPSLTCLPNRMTVGTRLTLDRLPELATLGTTLEGFTGTLHLRDCPSLDTFPTIPGLVDLVVQGQPWTRFPHKPMQARDVTLKDLLALETLGPEIAAHSLTLTHCPRLRELPHLDELRASPEGYAPPTRGILRWRLRPKGGLSVSGCHGLTTLPPGFRVPGPLVLSHCWDLEVLPPDLEARHLVLRRLPALRHLPEGLHVLGDLVLDGMANLEALPEGLQVDGDLVVDQPNPELRLSRNMSIKGSICIDPAIAGWAWPDCPKVFRGIG